MEFDQKLSILAASTAILAFAAIGWFVSSSGKKTKPSAKKSGGSAASVPDYSPRKISDSKQTFKPVVSEGEESATLRGYKKTADGRTTTYFHRELSEDEKKLLGDNAPKLISGGDAAAAVNNSNSSGKGGGGGGSAWNAAGTWEEKNYTQWAKTRVKEVLSGANFAVPGVSSGSIKVTSVSSVDGDAAVTMVRGKKRYIYDMAAEIQWTLNVSGDSVSGTLTISDITAECDYEFNVSVPTPPKSAALRNSLEKFVKSSSAGLQPTIGKILNKFLDDFKAIEAKR